MDSNVLIRVFDTELNYLGQVDDYESLIFRRKWSGYGESVLYAEAGFSG